MAQQKLAFCSFDIETTGLDAGFDKVLACVVKEPDKGPRVYRIDELSGEDLADDSRIVRAVINDLNQYPILIAHNGVRFDKPFLNTRSLFWGMEDKLVHPNGKIIDPVLLARRYLRLSYNSLERVSDALGCKAKKTKLDGRTWMRAGFLHERKALDYVVEHCVLDVLLLEEVAIKLLPFVGNINARGSA